MSIIIDILTGTMKLRDAWPKINSNFTGIKTEVDAIVTGSANAEVGQAHVSTVKSKTFTTLDDRLEEEEQDFVSAQAENAAELSLKVNKVTGKGLSTNDYDATEKAEVAKIAFKANDNEVRKTAVKLKLEDADADFLGAVAGTGTFDLLSIPQDMSVTPAKTNFLYTSTNLVDKSTMLSGYALETGTGNLIATETYGVSDFIKVTPSTDYVSFQILKIVRYDINKAYLGVHSPPDGTAWSSITGEYIRVHVRDYNYNTIQINKGSSLLAYEPFGVELSDNIKVTVAPNSVGTDEVIDGAITKDKAEFIKISTNIFDQSKMSSGYVVSSATGILIAIPNMFSSALIKSSPSQQITFLIFDRIVCYDIDGNFLNCLQADTTVTPITRTTHISTAFIRFSGLLAKFSLAQANKGDTLLPYEAFYEKLDGITYDIIDSSITTQKTDFALRGSNLFDDVFETTLVTESDVRVIANLLNDVYSVVIPITDDQAYDITKYIGGNRFVVMLLPEDPRTGVLPMYSLYTYRGADSSIEQNHIVRNQYNAKFLYILTNYGYVTKPAINVHDGVSIKALSISEGSVGLKHLTSNVTDGLNASKPYYFAPEPIVGMYKAKDATYVPLNVLADLYSAFETLATNYPEYVTKVLLGNDASGTIPIYQYTLKPIESVSNMTKKIPKILLDGLIHGGENPSTFALYYMVKALCEDWKTDSLLEYLRWNVQIVFIPVVNPYGYNTSGRFNANAVNIQKNADWAWDSADPDSGSSPFSEVETQYIKQMLDNNQDALLYVDIHAAGFSYDMFSQVLPKNEFYDENLDIASKYVIEKMTREFQKNYNISVELETTYKNDHKLGWTWYTNIPGATYMYAKKTLGITSCCVETFYRLPLDSTNYGSNSIKANEEYLINFLLITLNRYKSIL